MIKKFLIAGTAMAAGMLLSGSMLFAQGARPQDNTQNPGMPQYGNPNGSPYGNANPDMSPMTQPNTSQISPDDASFLRKAAAGGEAEVQLGTLAKDKASDPQVKEFANRMVDDHTRANNELKTLALQKGVVVPNEPDSHSKKEMDRLSRLNGPEFDRAYMKLMVSDHEKDVSEFNKESRSAHDSDVRSFASKTLPTLQDHLRMAREDNTKVGKS